MKIQKLLDKLNRYIGLGENADKEQVKKLRKVLKALKEKQEKLRNKLEQVKGEHERRSIKQQLEVIHRQREKGVEVYRAIKEAREQSD